MICTHISKERSELQDLYVRCQRKLYRLTLIKEDLNQFHSVLSTISSYTGGSEK